MELKDRMLGCLIGAAAGDAMGAATENRTRKQIAEKFGGYVRTFIAPPPDTFARGGKPGQITDDFSMAYVAINEILRLGGVVSHETAVAALLEWSKDEKFFNQFVGPTSRAAINALRDPAAAPVKEFVHNNSSASNGAAMKASPISLFAKGDVDLAIKIVTQMGMPTHGNQLSLAGAAAVAAATNKALQGGTLQEVMEVGIYGAQKGCEIGELKGETLAGPNMEKRIRFAIHLGSIAPSLSEAIDTMANYFDCSGMAADSVPVAFGLAVAAKGNPVEAICAAVNVGNDTDTIATMAGGILGAMTGSAAFPGEWVDILNQVNNYDLDELAKSIEACPVTIED